MASLRSWAWFTTAWCFPALLGRLSGVPISIDRLALGYSHWGPGQLDREMQENVWLSAPAKLDLLFDPDHESKWRRAMGILRVDPVLLSSVAGRA